jgi:hypothetical protein
MPVLIVALVLAGCGRASRHGVRVGIEQIASIAAEGRLMADDLARGATKTTFVRVHGSELSAQAEHEAEKLNDNPAAPDARQAIPSAISLASDIGGAIDDLRTSPQDRVKARITEHKLGVWADAAAKLAKTL